MSESGTPTDLVNEICRKMNRKASFIAEGDYFDKPFIKKLLGALGIALLASWVFYRESVQPDAPGLFSILLAVSILATIGIFWFAALQIYNGINDRKFARENLISELKQEVINSFEGKYRFNAHPTFPIALYRSCALFPDAEYDYSYAEDEITGYQDDLAFRLIEIRTEREHEDDDPRSLDDTDITWALSLLANLASGIWTKCKGHSDSGLSLSSRTVEVYRGLVFETEYTRDIDGITYVREDKLERSVGNVARRIQKVDSTIGNTIHQRDRLQLIELENPDFEKYYAVTTTDPIEARFILSSEIMESMVEIRETVGGGVSFCFQGSKMIVTINKSADFLDDKVDIEKIRTSVHRMRREITALTSMISKLKLDQYKKQNSGNWKKAS